MIIPLCTPQHINDDIKAIIILFIILLFPPLLADDVYKHTLP